MDVSSISPAILEGALVEIDRRLLLDVGDCCMLAHIEDVAAEFSGGERRIFSALVERSIALMHVLRRDAVCGRLFSASRRRSNSIVLLEVAATMVLRKGEGFDAEAFADAVLFRLPAEGEA